MYKRNLVLVMILAALLLPTLFCSAIAQGASDETEPRTYLSAEWIYTKQSIYDRVLWVYVEGENNERVDLSTVLVNGEVPAYLDGYPAIENDMIVTNCWIYKFLSTYRPFHDGLQTHYEVSYNLDDGTPVVVIGHVFIDWLDGDLNLDGAVDIVDLHLLTDHLWKRADRQDIEALADIDLNGVIDIDDVQALKSIIYGR